MDSNILTVLASDTEGTDPIPFYNNPIIKKGEEIKASNGKANANADCTCWLRGAIGVTTCKQTFKKYQNQTMKKMTIT